MFRTAIERVAHSGDYHTDLRAHVDAAWAVRVATEPEANAARLAAWRARFGHDDRLWADGQGRHTGVVIQLDAHRARRRRSLANHSRLALVIALGLSLHGCAQLIGDCLIAQRTTFPCNF